MGRFIWLGGRQGGGVRVAKDARAGNCVESGGGCLRSAHCRKESAGFGAADDVNAFDTTFQSALGGFEFQDHAARNCAILHEGFDFVARDGGDYFFSLQNTRDVGEVDELIGIEIFGASGGHVVGVDVVQLVVRTDAEAGGDGDEIGAPKRFDERRVHSGEITDETEASDNFVVHERFGAKDLCVGSGDADGGLARGGNRGRKLFVQKTSEDHDSDVTRFAIGDAETVDELAFDAEALERARENSAAAMDDEDFVALLGEGGDLRSQFANDGVRFEQSPCEFDHEFHCSPVVSSSFRRWLKF